MSKFKKHSLLILLAMIVLIMMPMSFAEDTSTIDTIGTSDTNVLQSDYDYETFVNETSIEYIIGESYKVTVTAEFDDLGDIEEGDGNWKVFINDDNTGIDISYADITQDELEFDISDISDKLVIGTNTVTFHPSQGLLEYWGYMDTFNYNPLTIIASDGSGTDSTIVYVDIEGDDDNNGTKDSPVKTIAKAIELASDDDHSDHKIIINKGTYYENNLNITSALDISGKDDVIIDAEEIDRIFNIKTTEVVNITGITFKNGKSEGDGGAILITEAQVNIDNCKFIDNKAVSPNSGSAIFWNANDGTLRNSYFTGNTARNAVVKVGKYSWSTGATGQNTLIENCVFDNNHNVEYGLCIGIDVETGCEDVSILNCNFTNNIGEAGSEKGALYIKGTNTIVDGCLFENNTMDRAPAILIDSDSEDAKITNSQFINNKIDYALSGRSGAIEVQNFAEITGNIFINNGGEECTEGGAISVIYAGYDGGDVVISDNTFIDNTAECGGAIYVDGGSEDWSEFDSLTIERNEFTANMAYEGSAIYVENSGNPITIQDNTIKSFDSEPIFIDEDTAYDVTEENNEIILVYYGIIYVDGQEGDDSNLGTEEKPVKTIAKAIELASDENNQEHSIIIIAGNYAEHDLIISSNLNITGQGSVVIDAEGLGRIFNITAGDEVYLTNLTLINGVAPKDLKGGSYWNPRYYAAGGAIIVRSTNTIVTIDGLTFINNTADDYGGAIDWEADDGIIMNSNFIDNNATYGGAIDWEGANGIILNSNFTQNDASNRGGAIDWEGDSATIINTIFDKNTAGTGAAVYMLNTRYSDGNTISNSTFTNNNAVQQGGAINIENEGQRAGLEPTYVLNNTFKNNYAYNGGAIADYYGSVNAVNNKFIENTAEYGAAIANSGDLTLEGNSIIDCEASILGVIYNIGEIQSMLNLVFINGDTIIVDDGKAVELNVTVTDDMGNPISGGEITFTVAGNKTLNTPTDLTDGVSTVKYTAHQNGTLEVSGKYGSLSIYNNVTVGYLEVSNAIEDYYGIIYVSESEGDDENLGKEDSPVKTFDQAMLLAMRENGSHTIIVKPGHYDVSYYELYEWINVTGEGNPVLDANYEHGIFGLYGEENVNFIISGLTFINGNATPSTYAGNQAGGAIFLKGGNLDLSDSTFINCTAGGYGGAIHINQGSRSTAPYSYTTYATITNCTFEGNFLEDNTPYNYHAGGAICVYSKAVVDIINSTFNNNFARYGGAIGFTSSSTSNVTIINSKFNNNTALREGGAVYLEAYDSSEYVDGKVVQYHWEVSIINSTFDSNIATDGGAADVANAIVDNCVFTNNYASANAGAIITNGNATISNNKFDNNVAGEFAGAILINEYSGYFTRIYEITLSNNKIENCYANYSNEIYSFSKVNIHGLNITVLDNTTKNFLIGNITIYATVTDDMGNEISAEDFTFIVNETEFTTYVEDGLATILYEATLDDTGAVVTADLQAAGDDVTIKTGVLNIKLKADMDISAVYDVTNNELVATVTNNITGKPVGNAYIQVNINGENTTAKTNAKGQVKVSAADLPLGTNTATFSYKGNSKYNPANTSIDFVVKANMDISVVYDIVNDELLATVTNINTGKPVGNAYIQVNINGENTTAKTNAKGEVKVSTADLPLGTYTATFSYKGNSRYNPAISSIDFTVKTNVIISDVYASPAELVATLTNEDTGKAVSNAKVKVIICGVEYNVKTNSKGQIKVSTSTLNETTFTPTISFEGNSKYNPTTVSPTLDLNKTNILISTAYNIDNSELVATLTNENTGKAISNANVQVSINGVTTTLKSNSKGQVTLSTDDLDEGTYVAVISYNGNSRYNPISTVAKVDV